MLPFSTSSHYSKQLLRWIKVRLHEIKVGLPTVKSKLIAVDVCRCYHNVVGHDLF